MIDTTKTDRVGFWSLAGPVARDALLITAATAALALGVNLFHPEKIPTFADKEYEILVPCPETGGTAEPMAADAPQLPATTTFVVDARPQEEFAAFHYRSAINVTYDYLDATPPEVLRDLAKRIARSRAQRVVVYGDGDEPDSGEELAKEISGHGIKNVFFIRGGAQALRAQIRREDSP